MAVGFGTDAVSYGKADLISLATRPSQQDKALTGIRAPGSDRGKCWCNADSLPVSVVSAFRLP